MTIKQAGLTLGLLTLAPVSPVSAQPYRYVDDQGVVHWVQSLQQIPDAYRAGAQTSSQALGVTLPAPPSTPRIPSPALTPVPRPQGAQPAPIEDEAVRRWKGKVLLEIQRLHAAIKRCKSVGQGNAACEQAQQELFLLEMLLSRAAPPPAGATQESLRQRYEYETRLLLGGLQYVAARLRDKESIAYEAFLAQMNAFRKDLEAFRTRYRFLMAAAEHRGLIDALMKASDLLIASAEAWTREMHPRASPEARDAARRERVTQWETVQRLIGDLSAHATGRDG
jgi:hypothetical protein